MKLQHSLVFYVKLWVYTFDLTMFALNMLNVFILRAVVCENKSNVWNISKELIVFVFYLNELNVFCWMCELKGSICNNIKTRPFFKY